MAKQYRGLIVATDGKRYLTRWRNTLTQAMADAERVVERKKISVSYITGHVKEGVGAYYDDAGKDL